MRQPSRVPVLKQPVTKRFATWRDWVRYLLWLLVVVATCIVSFQTAAYYPMINSEPYRAAKDHLSAIQKHAPDYHFSYWRGWEYGIGGRGGGSSHFTLCSMKDFQETDCVKFEVCRRDGVWTVVSTDVVE